MSQCPSRIISLSILSSLVVSIALLFTARPCLGASRQTQEKIARKACLSGDYSKGVSILADLFVETRDPVHVFNQGRCFEQNLRYREAIARFEEYLNMGETHALDSAARAAAEKHIADCKARLREEPDATAPKPFTQTAPPVVPTPAPSPTPKPEPVAQIVEQPKPSAESSASGSGLPTAGIVTGVVGIAAVGAGVAFNLKVNSMVNDMETNVNGYTRSRDSNRATYETLTWLGYGVGAACIATGAILVAVGAGSRHSSSASDIALAPTLGPGQAGILLRGGF